MIPKSFIQDLESRLNIVDVVRQYVPELKKNGSNYSACCPFHTESTPSFTVNESKGFYHCFGCPAHGKAINFVMEFTGQNFVEAVKTLASSIGMEVPDDKATPVRSDEERARAIRFRRAHELLKHAGETYSKLLSANEDAKDYLLGRGVSQATIDKFHLGYAPNEWNTITGNRSYIRETMLDSGLGKQKEGKTSVYDGFRDRVMFPIFSRSGENIIGFGGRAIHDQGPKYLNSPECLVFQKGNNLYGLKQAQDAIRQAKRVFVVEGYMDCAMISQYGVENVVATLGTSVTDEQIRLLFRQASHVTFCLDGDGPGQAAALRAAEICLAVLDEVKVVDFMFMPDELDPDEFVRQYGKEMFCELANKALTLTDFLLNDLARDANMQNSESIARFLARTNELAEKIGSAIVKLSFQKRVAELAGISLDTMLQMLREQNASTSIIPPTAQADTSSTSTQVAVDASELSVSAKMLAVCAIHSRVVVSKLDIVFLSKHLGVADRDMLFPLLVYIKSNPQSSFESIVLSLSFNPYAERIASLVQLAQQIDEGFDSFNEARKVVEQFRAFDRLCEVAVSTA